MAEVMLRDPKTNWEDGQFPYDALAGVGVNPDVDMQCIKDAFYEVIERGERSQEMRGAYNALKNVADRLWVDLFLYPNSLDEIVATLRKHRVELVSATATAGSNDDASESNENSMLHSVELLNDFDCTEDDILAKIEFATWGD